MPPASSLSLWSMAIRRCAGPLFEKLQASLQCLDVFICFKLQRGLPEEPSSRAQHSKHFCCALCLQGRYSFVGAQPSVEIIAKDRHVRIDDRELGTAEEFASDDPLETAVQLSSGWRIAQDPALPEVFTGGWVGYCGYDTVRYVYSGEVASAIAHWEPSMEMLGFSDGHAASVPTTGLLCIPLSRRAAVDALLNTSSLPNGTTQDVTSPAHASDPSSPAAGPCLTSCLAGCAGKLPFQHAPTDDRQLPDMHLALYNTVLVFDQATKLAYIITWVHTDKHESLEAAYQHGRQQLASVARKVCNENAPSLSNGRVSGLWPVRSLNGLQECPSLPSSRVGGALAACPEVLCGAVQPQACLPAA